MDQPLSQSDFTHYVSTIDSISSHLFSPENSFTPDEEFKVTISNNPKTSVTVSLKWTNEELNKNKTSIQFSLFDRSVIQAFQTMAKNAIENDKKPDFHFYEVKNTLCGQANKSDLDPDVIVSLNKLRGVLIKIDQTERLKQINKNKGAIEILEGPIASWEQFNSGGKEYIRLLGCALIDYAYLNKEKPQVISGDYEIIRNSDANKKMAIILRDSFIKIIQADYHQKTLTLDYLYNVFNVKNNKTTRQRFRKKIETTLNKLKESNKCALTGYVWGKNKKGEIKRLELHVYSKR